MTVDHIKRVASWLDPVARLISVLLSTAVVGIGLGWSQGLVAFQDPDASAFNAIAAGVVSTVLWPILYFSVIRPKLDLERTCTAVVCSVIFGIAGAIVVRTWGQWRFLPLSASCLGMLVASLNYRGRTKSLVTPSPKRIIKRILEGGCVLVCCFVIGCGEGFLQGLIVFRGFRVRGFSGLALAADTGASVGGVSAAVVCLVLYFILLKERLNLRNVTKLIVITSVSGLVSAMLIGPASAMATVMVLVIMSPFVAYPVAQQDSGESAA